MSSIVMAYASPGLLSVVMDLYPLTSGIAIATNLASVDTETPGFYISSSHAGTETGLHRVVVRKGTTILAGWYVDLTNTGNRDIAYDSDKVVLNNKDKTGYDLNVDQSAVTIGNVTLTDTTTDVTNVVLANMVQILTAVMVDPSPGRIADNFEDFFGNNNINSTIFLDDIARQVNLIDVQNAIKAMIAAPREAITSVTSNTQFIAADGPDIANSIVGAHIIIYNTNNLNTLDISRIQSYDPITKEYILETAPNFTVSTDDTCSVILNQVATDPVDLNPDQSSVTIGTVDNVTNPIEVDMAQEIPAIPLNGKVSASYANADRMSYKGGTDFLNVNIQEFENDEWKRVNEQVTLAEGYASSGSIHTVSQMMYLIMSILQNPQYVNFEFRARKLDGTSEAAAFQMDSDTNPTQHNRIR